MDSENIDHLHIKKEAGESDPDESDKTVVEEPEKELADVQDKNDPNESEEPVVEQPEKESADVQDENDTSVVDASDGAHNPPKTPFSTQKKSSFGTAFPCKYCPYSYKHERSLNSHVKAVHSEEDSNVDKDEEPIIEEPEKESEDVHDKTDTSLVDGNDGTQNSPKPIVSTQRSNSFGTSFPCQFCPYSYKLEASLAYHLKAVYSGERITSPKKVKKEVVDPTESQKGEEHKKKRVKMEVVDSKESEKDTAKLHCDSPGCTREFSSKIGLGVHKKVHSKKMANVKMEVKQYIKKGEMFLCDFVDCDREFPSKISLAVHKRCHTKEVKKEVKDDSAAVIHSNGADEREKSSHSQEMIISDDEKFSEEKEDENVSNVQCCPNCCRFYRNKFFLNRHLEKCREPRQAIHCIKCGQIFVSVDLLKEHFDSANCCEEKTDHENDSNMSISEPSEEEAIQVEPPKKRARYAKKELRKMTLQSFTVILPVALESSLLKLVSEFIKKFIQRKWQTLRWKSSSILKKTSNINFLGEMFLCDFVDCDREFPSKISLAVHKRCHTKEVKKEVKDDSAAVIHSNGADEREKSSHSQEMIISDDEKFSEEKEDENVSNVQCCPNCCRFYRNKFFLNRHLEKCREPRQAIHCIKCGQIFVSVDLLKEHFDSANCCEEKTDPENDSNMSISEPSEEEAIQVEPPKKRARYAKKELRKMTSVPMGFSNKDNKDQPSSPSSEDESENAISLLKGENIEKSPFALLWTVVSTRARIHKNEMMVIWSDKFDETHLNVISGFYNVVFCFKSVGPLQLAAQHTYALKQTSLLTFLLKESDVTFTQWTVITFNKQNALANIDSKVFKKLADVETKLAGFADKNEMSLTNGVAFSENEFFASLVKKLTKKILVFNAPE